MCCFSTRVSQGGSIAVLRSTLPADANAETSPEMRVLFQNDISCSHPPGTQIEFQGWQPPVGDAGRYWVVIHRNGDLSAPVPTAPMASLLSNSLFAFSFDNAPDAAMLLPQRLNLGVGDEGIIGRRVSLMTAASGGPMTVAEGIAGWN